MQTEKLIRLCKKRNTKGQEALYRAYAPVLFGLSLKYCSNRQEAEDNLQESFITIFEKIHQYKGKGSFEGWLKRITINNALQRYRKRRYFKVVDEEALAQPEEEGAAEGASVELKFLLKIIQDLPDRYRLVFNLYVMDGYSHKEIAEMLDISEGTSKSNLSRARQSLKERIETHEKLPDKKLAK